MKALWVLAFLALGAALALAEKPPVETELLPMSRVPCEMANIAYDWDFTVSDWGFTTAPCDDQGEPTWEYGETVYWPDLVWATTLSGAFEEYPDSAGESLISPSFIVDASAYLVEVFHGYYIEWSYDGGNLSVNGTVVVPMGGYPDDEISDSENFYAWCVDGEPGFTGDVNEIYSCFDLSSFMGEEVQLSFDFGSDASVQSRGWYIAVVRVGGDVVSADETTWSAVKGLYR